MSIHMENGGLILTRKLPAAMGVYREEVMIDSDCNSSTGNVIKKQKIEV